MLGRDNISCSDDRESSPTELDFKVDAIVVDGRVKFSIRPENEGAERHYQDDHIKLPKDSGAFEIRYKLKDETGRGLKFREECPISASEHEECPTYEGLDTRQITVVDRDDLKLVINNENYGAHRTIGYILHFVDKAGTPEPFDPIILNGGGTKTFT
jgi:hypothetical protein